jgi:phage I-like protein
VALTNDPAIKGMAQAAALTNQPPTPHPENIMHPLLVQLLARIGITVEPDSALDAAALTALLDSEDAKTGMAALTAQLDKAGESATKIAALTAQVAEKVNQVDLAQYVPVATFNGVIAEMATLKANHDTVTVSQVIEEAQKAGKFIAAAELGYLTDLGNTNIAALKANLQLRPANPALQGKQTTEQKPDAQDHTNVAALSADHKLVADQLGISHDDYAKQLAAEQA